MRRVAAILACLGVAGSAHAGVPRSSANCAAETDARKYDLCVDTSATPDAIYWCSTTTCSGAGWVVTGDGGGGGAPTGAGYWTKTADATLTNEQDMSALASGLILNTTGTGVPTIYGGAACTNQVVEDLSASGAPTCVSITGAYITAGSIPDGDLGSDYSGTGDCGAGNFARTLNDAAAPTCAADDDVPDTGEVSDAALANNYSGVGACGANTWASTLNDNAAPTCTQPAFSNLSGTASDAQVSGSGEADELVLAGDASGTANANQVTDLTISGEVQGDLLIRGASAWVRKADSGTSGLCLLSGGGGGDPDWASCPGGGGGLSHDQVMARVSIGF
jgi:hypothetical protein